MSKIRGFVLDKRTGNPLSGVKVSAVAEFESGDMAPVGTLASDAAGYVSFHVGTPPASGQVKQVSLVAQGDDASRIDVTRQSNGDGAHFVLAVDPTLGSAARDVRIPSVQRPDAADVDVSPASFARQDPLILGSGSCEVPIPAHEAEYSYRFTQIVRTTPPAAEPAPTNGAGPGVAIGPLDPTVIALPEGDLPLVAGELLEFKQSWQSLGHSLGSIAYSLPLAPGEIVNVAVIDWSRRDLAMRDDAILSREGLLHSQRRDRTIEEVVNAALRESQGGWSLLGGVSSAQSLSASGTVPVGSTPIEAAASDARIFSLGGAISQSWGERDLSGRSLQSLHDLTTQATNVVRSLNSTVVVQATAEEQNYLETRTVANYNQCHALTVQFYEVLRQFKIVTEYAGSQKVLLLPFRLLDFGPEQALRYRLILESVLLDDELRDAFEALVRVHRGGAPASVAPARAVLPQASSESAAAAVLPPVARYELTLESSGWNWSQTWGAVWVHVGLKDGSWRQVWMKDFHRDGGGELQKGRFTLDVTDGEAVGVDPTQIDRVRVSWQEDNGNDSWGFRGITLRCASGNQMHTLVDQLGAPELKRFDDSGAARLEWTHPATTPQGGDPVPDPAPGTKVKRYELLLKTSEWNWSTTWGAVWVHVGLKDGSWRQLWMKDFNRNGGGELTKTRAEAVVTAGEAIGVALVDIDRIRVSWQEDNGNDSWGFKGITLKAELESGDVRTLVAKEGTPELKRFDDSGNQPLSWIDPIAGSGPGPGPGPEPGPAVSRYEVTIETSDWNWSTTWGAVWVRLGLKNGAWRTLYFKETKGRGGGELPKHSFIFDVLEGDAIGVEPAQIDRVKVSWVEDNGNDSWGFAGLTIRYATPGSGLHTIIDAHGSPELKRFDDAATVIDWIEAVSVENPDPGDGEDPAPTQPDRQAVSRLLAHLRANAGFYNRAIWLMQDTSERTLMLDHALRDQPELRHSIEDTPLGVSGNYVAFRWNRPPTEQELDREERRKQALTPKQDVATLPTRGLFAETHLSSCTACEVRDVTRRDWNESPIPHQPPAIGGVEPGPQSQPLPTPSPGSLPQAVVNIAEAPKAPDPVGLAAALGLLGKSDLFRDMSGLDEVGKLLHDLTTGATTLAAAKQLAAKAIEKLGETKAGGDGGAKGGKALPNETQPGKQVDKLQAVKYAQEAGLIDAEQAADAATGILGGTPVPASWPAGGAETPGSQVDLTGSVGFGGSNQPDDVRTVQQRLVALGFDWVPTNGTVGGTQSDDVTVKAIKLFQSIVIGSRKVVGDGCVDVGGGTHKWLRAANAPRWLEVPAGSFADGYRNSELEEPEQFDHATSWMTATIEGAGAAYKIAHIDNHPTGTTPALLTLNDFSPPRGGDAQGHAGHETGLDCDMRVPKKDGTAPGTGAEAGITWNKGNGSQVNPDYDRDAMRAMLTAITNQPLWRRTFFNDPVLIGEGLCTAQPDHDDHAHFEINPPVRAGAFELGGGEMWA